MMTTSSERLNRTSLFRNQSFLFFFTSRSVSLLGDAIHQIALAVMVYQWTQSAKSLGYAMFFLMAPKVFFGLLSGPVADRMDRKKIMIAVDFYRAAAVALIPFVPSVEYLYALMATLSAAESFYNTARISFVPSMLKNENELVSGNSLLQTATTITMIVGPAIGGAIVAAAGTTAAFFIDALTFFAAALLIIFMPDCARERSSEEGKSASALTDIRDGFYYLVRDSAILFITIINSLILGSIFLTSSLTVVIAERITSADGHQAARALSYIISMSGIGSLCGGLLLPLIALRISAKNLIIGGFFLATLELFCFALTRNLYIILFAVTISNICFVIASVTSTTQLQLRIKEAYRGRVLSIYGVITALIVAIAVAGGGWLCDVFGVESVYLAAGFICIMTSVLAWIGVNIKNKR